ncbi:MAG: hypothetical protein AAB227_02660, partial [Pseudomonadota bacterium]
MQADKLTIEEAPPGDQSAIGELIGAPAADDRLQRLISWIKLQLSSVDVTIQLGVIAAALIPAALFGPQLRKLIMAQVAPRAPYGVLRRAANAFAHIATPIALYLTWQGAALALAAAGRKSEIVTAAISLLAAWIVIRLITLVIRSPFWSRAAFYVVWPIAALDAAGLLDEAVRYLNGISIPIGVGANGAASSFSALDLVRVIFIFAALFWISSLVSRFLKSQISSVDELTPSLQALLIKILDVVLPAAAFLLGRCGGRVAPLLLAPPRLGQFQYAPCGEAAELLEELRSEMQAGVGGAFGAQALGDDEPCLLGGARLVEAH